MVPDGGNSDNSSNCGSYVNLNNDAGNAWWNNGAALTYPYYGFM